jgi:hypothetical protein
MHASAPASHASRRDTPVHSQEGIKTANRANICVFLPDGGRGVKREVRARLWASPVVPPLRIHHS